MLPSLKAEVLDAHILIEAAEARGDVEAIAVQHRRIRLLIDPHIH